jgi:dTDP-4-amino-4,6-dideoxygalactose transaminase
VIEDAAQGIASTYNGRNLGSIGHMAALSFHETKNLLSGEGGALLINDARFVERAEIIREKGTNRSKFFRGEVDKYTWVDMGSSYLPSELNAAFLLAQLENCDDIIGQRLAVWNTYHEAFVDLEDMGLVRRPFIPANCQHNGHMYYLLLNQPEQRDRLLQYLKSEGIYGVFHYIPLHSAPAGQTYGRPHGEMQITDRVSETLVRLPLWVGVDQETVIEKVRKFFTSMI